MKYDIIGDIHGQALKLQGLLKILGYQEKNGGFMKEGHKAVFLGDFIDRGSEQLKTIQIIRNMVESGNAFAVMGNHEYNAMAWYTRDPFSPDLYLRTRVGVEGSVNRAQHLSFLAECEMSPEVHADAICWFKTLPLWLDLPEFRVVHACWHSTYIENLTKVLTSPPTLSMEEFIESCRPNSEIHDWINCILNGWKFRLPNNLSYIDKHGKLKKSYKLAWWRQSAKTLKDIAIIDSKNEFANLNGDVSSINFSEYDNTKPIFFGHYWMVGLPKTLAPKIACLDFSGNSSRPIVAYRWDGETVLNDDNFVYYA